MSDSDSSVTSVWYPIPPPDQDQPEPPAQQPAPEPESDPDKPDHLPEYQPPLWPLGVVWVPILDIINQRRVRRSRRLAHIRAWNQLTQHQRNIHPLRRARPNLQCLRRSSRLAAVPQPEVPPVAQQPEVPPVAHRPVPVLRQIQNPRRAQDPNPRPVTPPLTYQQILDSLDRKEYDC